MSNSSFYFLVFFQKISLKGLLPLLFIFKGYMSNTCIHENIPTRFLVPDINSNFSFKQQKTIMILQDKAVLTLKEACEYLGFKKSYVYKLTSAGILPFSKPNGKAIFFDKQKLEQWMLMNPSSSLSDKKAAATNYVNTATGYSKFT